MSDKDFGERPLVADSLVGARSFGVDKWGRLHGVTHTEIWTPGENEATCRVRFENDWNLYGGQYSFVTSHLSYPLRVAAAPGLPTDVKPKAETKHQVATLGCACGFYAYFDTGLGYGAPDRINALVRGSGVATVGSRGFRVERAEIVALIEPRKPKQVTEDALRGREYDSLSWRERRRHHKECPQTWPKTHYGSAEARRWPLLSPRCSLHPDHGKPRYFSFDRDMEPVTQERVGLVKRNYPDVPWFASLDEAVKAFPLSTPPAPHVPSPADADFWTKPIQH